MSKKILLADDSVTIQKVVELTFMEEDYEVLGTSSGDGALARLEEVAPDLVIADVHMPGATGYEVCRQVKERHPAVPVLLLVGTFEPFDEAEANRCGADGHLKKPFDSQELLRRVDELLAGGAPEGEPAAAPPAVTTEDAPAPPATAADAGASAPGASAARVTGTGPSAEPPSQGAPAASADLSTSEVDRIARRVVELLGDRVVREVAWEVLPDLAEVVIKDRLRELESQVE